MSNKIMKKLALIAMICMYAISSVGIGIKAFYCCGQLKSTSIGFIQQPNDNCGMDNEPGGCCKTSFKSLQVKDSHVAADVIHFSAKHFIQAAICYHSFETGLFTANSIPTAHQTHAPPLLKDLPVYKLICSYRI
jgi:hypothetical protein